LLLPVVGDEGEVLDVDEAVEVEVAGGAGGGGFLPVVGSGGLVLVGDVACTVGAVLTILARWRLSFLDWSTSFLRRQAGVLTIITKPNRMQTITLRKEAVRS
jgi:hypothetical protein